LVTSSGFIDINLEIRSPEQAMRSSVVVDDHAMQSHRAM